MNFWSFLLKCTKMCNDITTAQSCDPVQRKVSWSSEKSCKGSPLLILGAVVYKPDGNFCVRMAFNHAKTHICRRPGLLIETQYLQTNKLLKKETKFHFKACFTGSNTKTKSSHYIQKTSKLSPHSPYLENPIISGTKTNRDHQALCQSCLLSAKSQGSCSGVLCR